MARQLQVPFGEIGDMSRKQPMSINIFRLSNPVTALPALTTTYEQAEKQRIIKHTLAKKPPPKNVPRVAYTANIISPVRDQAFQDRGGEGRRPIGLSDLPFSSVLRICGRQPSLQAGERMMRLPALGGAAG